MQWSSEPNAGFTNGRPWLPLGHDYPSCNARAERQDPNSILNLYRRLIELRRSEPALSVGAYIPLPTTGDVLSYVREAEGKRFLVALNLGHGSSLCSLGTGRIRANRGGNGQRLEGQAFAGCLRTMGDEGVVVELEGQRPPTFPSQHSFQAAGEALASQCPAVPFSPS